MRFEEIQKRFDVLFREVNKVVVGQQDVIEQVMAAILCDGHALLEGNPGLAKTLVVRTLSDALDLKFSRIQGTPDLLPSDITGTYIIDDSAKKREFKFQPGPVFANVVLLDELNRAAPKTHSALLEAMQERQVTVGNSTFKLDTPFLVLATQNPIEQEGTFKLSEAQADRFLFKILVTYPKYEEELEILERFTEAKALPSVKAVFGKETIMGLQALTRQVPIAHDFKKYAVDVVTRTRTEKKLIEYGASPRASISLVLAAKARALLHNRKHVSKEDLQAMAYPVLRHRIILNFEAERNNMDEDAVIEKVLGR